MSAAKMACPLCEGVMVFESRPNLVSYQDHSTTIESQAWWCDECEEVVLEGEEVAKVEAAFLRLKAQAQGVLAPEDVRRIRERLGLSQRQAGMLLGGGIHAFYRYENGKVAVSQPMSNLLRLLDHDPELLARLRPLEPTSSHAQ